MSDVGADAAAVAGAGLTGEWQLVALTLTDSMANGEALRLVTQLLVALITAVAIEWLYWFHAGRLRQHFARSKAANRRDLLQRSLPFLCVEFLGMALSTFAPLALIQSRSWTAPATEIITVVALTVGIARMLVAVANLLLAPQLTRIRLLPVLSQLAGNLYRTLVSLAILIALGIAGSRILGPIFGLPTHAGIFRTLIIILTATRLFRLSELLRKSTIRGPSKVGTPDRLMPFLTGFGMVTALVMWLADYGAVAASLGIAGLLIMFDRALRQLFRSIAPRGQTEHERLTGHLFDALSPVIERFVRICGFAIFVEAIMTIWKLTPGAAGAPPAALLLWLERSRDVVFTLLVASGIWLLIQTFISRRLALQAKGRDADRAGRIETLLPMLRVAVLVAIAVVTVLTVLNRVGIDIAPLLAGAGIVGLAIGFGAQTLVRDIITGIFFLFEDAFRVGEYIEVGTKKGVVEAISLRSVRLRHHRGALHTVPFGEIKSLSNVSRDWSIIKLEFRVPFETDVEQVRKMVKKIGEQIAANPDLGPNLIEPLKSQGIVRMEEHFMVLAAKFTAKPNDKQFLIRREAFRRIRDGFEEAGIKLGDRKVLVALDGEATAAHGGAAAAVIAEEAEAKAAAVKNAAEVEPG
jgi:moderate conductance mechanosensitive channel